MPPAYNLHFAELQALGDGGVLHKIPGMGMKPRKIATKPAGTSGPGGNGVKTWTQTPKGLPAVTGQTSFERARLVRYFMTRDDQSRFAKLIGVDIKTWNQFERGPRPISNPVMDKIVQKVPGITHAYLKWNKKDGLGPAFLDLVNKATDAAGNPPRKS